jgi:hypothetical protein
MTIGEDFINKTFSRFPCASCDCGWRRDLMVARMLPFYLWCLDNGKAPAKIPSLAEMRQGCDRLEPIRSGTTFSTDGMQAPILQLPADHTG